MSVWTQLATWGLSQAKTEAQQVGLKATQELTDQIGKILDQHAPDMAPMLKPLAQQLVAGIVAGVMTRSGH